MRVWFTLALATLFAATGCGSPASHGGQAGSGGRAGNGDAGATGAGAGRAGTGGAPTGAGGSGVAGTGAAGTGAAGAPGTGGRGGNAGAAAAGGSAAGGSAGRAGAGGAAGGAPGAILSAVDIADVWSGDPVGFALVTQGNRQFAAFYDANQNMTIAARTLDSTSWQLVRLPTVVGWDSHNYIAMAIDSGGFIHVAGNMHAVPLIYFRTTAPFDISTFQRVTAMVGTNESSCTYPQFIHGPNGDFVFAYRDGVSGNGNYVFNVYDVPTKRWTRLLNTPLTDGQGLRNAYPDGPTLGPDGWWHLVYVWRETGDASTNHDLSYARSKDLVSWETGTGKALTLPITLATSDIVDAVPQNGGIINNNTKVGFDSQNRPVVAYHKYDAAGNTQLYNARVEGGKWVTHQTSNWTYRWNIGGTGALVFQIQLEGVKLDSFGRLIQVWYHAQYGGWSAFQVDETTLAATATLGRTLPYPASLETVQSTTAGMGVRWATDTGAGPDPTVLYMLRWETLPENMDQPRATVPPPTRLRLYGFRQ